MPADSPLRAYEQLASQHARFAVCFDPSLNPGAEELGVDKLCELIPAAVEHGQQAFELENPRHSAQLWLYSFLGDVLSPAMHVMVGEQVYPDLSGGANELFLRQDDFWFGYAPKTTVDTPREAGAALARLLMPVVEKLGTAAGLKPAPAWAVVADGVVQPAVAMGNEEFETQRAMDCARDVLAGIEDVAGVRLPAPRFEQILDQQMLPIEDEEPEYLVAHRCSCCMIYHSPKAGLCTSCPHQEKDVRINALIAAAEYA